MGVAVDGLGPVVQLASAEAADDPKAQSCLTGGRNPVSAAEGHLSAQAIRCAEGTGHRPQRMQLWLRQSTTWPVRTAPASRAADGQSADCSARYNFLYSSQGRPCGRPPPAAVLAPAATRRPPGHRPLPSLSGVRSPRWRFRRSLIVASGHESSYSAPVCSSTPGACA
jgi:hypothetical protein